jgi:tetratricopeptide (TPR) repeat protein
LYRRRQQSPRTLYEAYDAFKDALALSGEDEFEDGLVQLEYKTAEEELVEQVTRHYYNTYALVGAGRYHDAERALRRLIQEIYPDDQSRLFAHANRLLRYVRRHTKD